MSIPLVIKETYSSAHIIVYLMTLLTGFHTMGMSMIIKDISLLTPRPDADNTICGGSLEFNKAR